MQCIILLGYILGCYISLPLKKNFVRKIHSYLSENTSSVLFTTHIAVSVTNCFSDHFSYDKSHRMFHPGHLYHLRQSTLYRLGREIYGHHVFWQVRNTNILPVLPNPNTLSHTDISHPFITSDPSTTETIITFFSIKYNFISGTHN